MITRRAFHQLNARSPLARIPRRNTRTASSENGLKNSNSSPAESGPKSLPNSLKSKDEPIDIPTSLWYQRLGPVTDFFTWFHRTQQKRPLTVQVCTSLTVYLCGDLLAQEIGGEKYDSTRTLRMLTIGAMASVPGYKWYERSFKPGPANKIGFCSWETISITHRRSSPSSRKWPSNRYASPRSSTATSSVCKQYSQANLLRA